MQLRYRNAGHGYKLARLKELQEFTAGLLRREVGRGERRVRP